MSLVLVTGFFLNPALSQEEAKSKEDEQPVKEQEFTGEFFGIKVPMQNYQFIKSAVMVFGSRGVAVKTPAEEEEQIWEQMLLSYEAFRRDIVVTQEELDSEVGKLLQAEKITFDRKADPQAYEKWVKEKTSEPVELFENQLRHLLQIEKLRQQIIDIIQPEVTEEEAHEKFINEYNSLSVELVEFNELKEAEDFYKKAKADEKFWEGEKGKRPKDFKRPGFVSREFLMDIWRFPREAVRKMIGMKTGGIHPPAPIYKGYAVFKVLETRPADEARYRELKPQYYEKVKMLKKIQGFDQWFKDFKQQADIKVYVNAAAASSSAEDKKQEALE